MQKDLIFPCGTEIGKYKSVQLTMQEGLCGFEVITSQSPSDQ
jgi:hypothetical protein